MVTLLKTEVYLFIYKYIYLYFLFKDYKLECLQEVRIGNFERICDINKDMVLPRNGIHVCVLDEDDFSPQNKQDIK